MCSVQNEFDRCQHRNLNRTERENDEQRQACWGAGRPWPQRARPQSRQRLDGGNSELGNKRPPVAPYNASMKGTFGTTMQVGVVPQVGAGPPVLQP